MMKNILLVLGLVSPMIISQPVLAERTFGQIYTDCGLGGLIGSAIENRTASQIIAIITNVTFDLGTTAVTSQLSSPDTCAGGKGAVAAYINQSYDAIEQELASGYGEHLDTLKVLARGDDNFNSELRSQFAVLLANPNFNGMTHFDKAEAVFNMVTMTN